MCVSSMIYDYGRQNPPWQNPAPWPNSFPVTVPSPLPDREAADAIKKFLKLLEDAKEYDRATKQPDCEDPEKSKFMIEVLDRLAAIEKRLDSLQPAT